MHYSVPKGFCYGITFFFLAAPGIWAQVPVRPAQVSSQGRNPDTLTAKVPYSVFPIGAIRYGNIDTLEKMLGMNFGYNLTDIKGTRSLPQEASPVQVAINLRDPFYYDSNAERSITEARYLLDEAARAHDVRVFMPGTAGALHDYTARWKFTTGENYPLDNSQWIINASDRGDADQYVLRDLNYQDADQYTSVDPYYGNGHYEAPTDFEPYKTWNESHIGTASYEFVFFMNWDHFTLGHDEPLYQIEYWVKEEGSSAWNKADSQVITYNTYSNLPSTNFTVQGHSGSGDSLRWWGRPQQVNDYRTLKKILDIRPYYHGNYSNAGDDNRMKIDVRLKSFYQWPVFPHLLRIRDWRGQQLLGGKADGILKTAIDSLKKYNSENTLSSWVINDEPYNKHFRAWAYVNELMQMQNARPASVLAPWAHVEFIRTIRDQLGIARYPGPLWYDWYPFRGSGGRIFNLKNGVASFNNYYQGLPVPADAAGDSARQMQHGLSVINDYDTYTKKMQDIIGYNSDSSDGHGWSAELNAIAASHYEDPLRQIPFYMMGQSYVTRQRDIPWRIDSLAVVSIGLSDANRRAVFADSLHYHDVILPYLNRAYTAGTIDSLCEDSLYDVNWGNRATTEPEMLYQTWSALLHGVKGFAFSTAMDDYQEQIGILTDIDGVNDIRSSERKNIKFNEYMFGLRSGKSLLDPWSHDTLRLRTYKCDIDSSMTTGTYRYSDTLNLVDSMRWPRCVLVCDKQAWHSHTSYTNFNRSDSLIPLSRFIHFDCNAAIAISRFANLPPMYKPMFGIVRSIVTDEISPVAATLARLQWQGALSWHKRTRAQTVMNDLPIKDLTSKQITNSTYTGIRDPDSSVYADIGLFKHPDDSSARFVIIQNRRLWPDTNVTGAKGKIDYRVITFGVDTTKFDPLYRKFDKWKISDVSGQLPDTIITAAQTYSFILKPGQGKLLRITPPADPQANPRPANASAVKVQVVPNPFQSSSRISIDVPKDIPLTVTLYDIIGRPAFGFFDNIAEKEHYDFLVTKNEITTGLYFLRVRSGSKVVTRKLELIR